jgi:hypothetical protein
VTTVRVSGTRRERFILIRVIAKYHHLASRSSQPFRRKLIHCVCTVALLYIGNSHTRPSSPWTLKNLSVVSRKGEQSWTSHTRRADPNSTTDFSPRVYPATPLPDSHPVYSLPPQNLKFDLVVDSSSDRHFALYSPLTEST